MKISGNNEQTLCYNFFFKISQVVILLLLSGLSFGQDEHDLLAAGKLKKLSLEELMDIEVTSVSKHAEKLADAASAIQVITQNDIRSSGAKTLAEALRLAPNLQVAQVNSSQWAITARGFNNVLANKLLVLLDGRTIYTPLYAGVFWDVQNVMLEDVDRIEVISGPGGTLWGANAVNGVINIITKNAAATQGLLAEAAIGSYLSAMGSLRYGGKIKEDLSYRVFGTGFKMGSVLDTNGTKVNDDWTMFKGGFRLDWDASTNNKLSLQANIYDGRPNPDASDTSVIARGQNIVARWTHILSAKSNFQLQAYYDHTLRDFGNGFTEDLKTFDIDWQNRYRFGQRHELSYGLGFRLMDHTVTNLERFTFLPEHKTLYLYSAFVQDKIMLIKDRLDLIVGSKIEHNSYTGFEYQPNGRISWMAAKDQTLWAAVSRAVRTPARIDRDFSIFIAPNLPLIAASDKFISENVLAYELGWRVQLQKNISISLATFYNRYNDLRSAEPGPPPFNIPITFANGVKGETYGAELSAIHQVNTWWNLRGGYTFMKKELLIKTGSNDLNKGSAESNDPEHQFLVQSTMNISDALELGTVFRYIGKLPKPQVPGYAGWDLRIGWKLGKVIELNIVGQNLLEKRHPEFIPSNSPREIERSIYGKIICRI